MYFQFNSNCARPAFNDLSHSARLQQHLAPSDTMTASVKFTSGAVGARNYSSSFEFG